MMAWKINFIALLIVALVTCKGKIRLDSLIRKSTMIRNMHGYLLDTDL